MTGRIALATIAAVCVACLLVGAGHWLLPQPQYNSLAQLVAYPGKYEVARPAITPRTMVAFVFGQSNSANHGSARFHAASPAISNFWSGKFYAAEDPLLGATGDRGGPWVLMANRLIEAGAFDQVILIAAGVGASSVQEWTTGGRLNAMLVQRLAEARHAGLTVTHFLWHQGEQDNSAARAADYDAAIQPVIALTKRFFPQSKFFAAVATLCGTGNVPNPKLQRVQRDLVRLPGVFAGPNTDEIGFADRQDGCHLNGSGLRKHADGWVAAIAAPRQ